MSDESTATATPADPAAAEQATAPTEHLPAAIGTLWLAVLALGWLALTVRSTLASLATHDHTVSVTAAAIGLPAAISAALVGGAGIGLAARRLFRAHPERPIARFSAALGAGFLTGVATAATLVLTSTAEGSRIMVLSGTVAAAATIGGAIAGIRAGAVVGAAVAASLALFLLTLLRELFTSPLLSLFGADEDPVSLLNAQRWLGLTSSLLGGVLGGLVAFGYLRRATRAGGAAPRWPAYLWAGGGAGLMLLLTEVITRVGGARLLALARAISEGDSVFQDLADQSRANAALVVFFIGAITAIIAFGRTLPSPADDTTDDENTGDENSGDESAGGAKPGEDAKVASAD